MAFASIFFALFVLSHLVLLQKADGENNSQSICPASFQCGPLGLMKFPFTNITPPFCGLCKVDCEEKVPQVQLGRWQPVGLLNVSEPNTIHVRDLNRQKALSNQNCLSFTDFQDHQDSPAISFKFSPNITFFRCYNISRPELTQPEDVSFRGYYSYRGCQEFSIYYKYPKNPGFTPPGSLPPHCSAILRPFSGPHPNLNVSDPFSLMAVEFSLEFYVSDECLKCHSGGGQCKTHNRTYEFYCEGTHKKPMTMIIIAASAGGLGIFLILGFCFKSKLMFFIRRKINDYHDIDVFLKNYGSLAPRRYSYSDVKRMTNAFKVKLGQGGYGCVYRGTLQNGNPAAVKILNESKGIGEEFMNEVLSISRTSHVNIVTLFGFCSEDNKRALIYEFMPNGSLEKFIYGGSSSADRQLRWDKLYQIAIGIARGLEYLHRGCNTRILHLDIKPHNILLDKDFCPKISDFGLAKLCPRKESMVSMLAARGTIGYIAPEVFCRSFGGVSHKSDVYSYGMMVLEMVGHRKNIDVQVDHASEIYFPDWIYGQLELKELKLQGITNEAEFENARKMIIVGLGCIQTDPSNRPSMTKVVEMLEGSLESLQIPPKPFLSSSARSQAQSPAIEASHVSIL